MNTVYNRPISEIVNKRYSVRTYSGKPISDDVKQQISTYIETLSNPFSVKVTFKLLQTDEALNSQKLGTYGMIKGTSDYIGAIVENTDMALEAVGYEFEKLILYLTSLGIGTCWLGGTFNKGEFSKAFQIKEGELFPAISPFGYFEDKRSIKDNLIRFAVKADKRKDFEEIFYHKDFEHKLTKSTLEDVGELLELVRLAPSASNKQPWRIIVDGNNFHFFEEKTPGYSDRFTYDIQKLDLGIAICHLHLGLQEMGYKGEFKKLSLQYPNSPKNSEYIVSWVGTLTL